MRKIKKRKICILAAALALAVMAVMPVSAATSWLDVNAGDVYSYYTYKDGGEDWENYYYVTTDTYVGYPILARSSAQIGNYTSSFTQIEGGANSYWYGKIHVPGGINYRITSSPSYLSGSNWHLTGYYTP